MPSDPLHVVGIVGVERDRAIVPRGEEEAVLVLAESIESREIDEGQDWLYMRRDIPLSLQTPLCGIGV